MDPMLTIITKSMKVSLIKNIKGISVITVRDTRWSFPDIKTTQLLPNILAKSEAKMQNCEEAIFFDADGFITEGSSSNVWIISANNVLYTRKLDGKILPGITRNAIFECAKNCKLNINEKKFTIQEMISATEVFITSAHLVTSFKINIS